MQPSQRSPASRLALHETRITFVVHFLGLILLNESMNESIN